MNSWLGRITLFALCLWLLPRETPAPFIYRAGEGWTYEPAAGAAWRRENAEDQLKVAQEAFDKKQYGLAIKAGKRTVRTWPIADDAPPAQYLVARAYEEKGNDEKAFKAYQTLIEKYPKSADYEEVLQRQYTISKRYLAGQWFKLWGVIPFPSMDKTVNMLEKIIKNGPYSQIAPNAQMEIGTAREKQKKYSEAVKAYERAADRYHDQPAVAADALYRAGLAYTKQAKRAEYDQSVAGRAIETFGDFMTLFPDDSRVPEAQEIIASLRTEQARGNFEIARYYEKRKRWEAAKIYYNEAWIKDRHSKYGEEARRRIDAIQKRIIPDPPKIQAKN